MTTPNPVGEARVGRLRAMTGGWPDDLLDPRRPAFLSQSRPGGAVGWYAVAHSPRQARELREYLLAFVGPSHSDFAGQAGLWDPADPVEAELAVAFPHGFRLTARASDAADTEKLFARLRQMLNERPARSLHEPPALGRVLRDFELLLRAGDWSGAARLLDRLRDRGQLTADQLAGLRLRLLAGQERWAEVLAAPELPTLVGQRLPAAVGEAVAAAIYHEHLARFTSEAEAAAHYREHVGPAFGLVFRQRTLWHHPDAVKAATIADAALRPVAVPEATPPPKPVDPYEAAVEAHDAGDDASALTLLLAGPFTPDSVRLLTEVALDLGTHDATQSALAAIRDCPAPVREKAFARRAARAVLEELEEIGAADAPADWGSWLKRATQGPWPEAAEAAWTGVAEWPRPDPAAFNAALSEGSGETFLAIRESLPAVLALLIPEGTPDPRFGPAYRVLLERVVLDDDLSPATAPAVSELAAAVLGSNPVASPARNDYRELVEALSAAWKHLKRPALLDWGLGLLDLAAEHAVHRYADVAPLAQDIASEFARVPRLATAGQRALLRAVCAELDIPAVADLLAPPPEPGVPSPVDEVELLRKKLGKRSVVLLTLQDRIAAGFRSLMREHYPDARIDVVQEYAGGKRLRDVAAGADVFIVNTFDAKHAATTYIPQHRPAGAPTLYPKGKNAARQIDALEDWLRSLP
ncbi:MAG: protein DpdD [Gemmataceae bacterium]